MITTAPAPAPVKAPAYPDQFEVEVTEEDIALGAPEDPGECPIARATRRWFTLRGTPISPLIAGYCAAIDSAQYDYRHDGIQFVCDFDLGEPVAPCRVRFTRV